VSGDMRGQVEAAMNNVETVLAAGGLSLANVVRLNFYTQPLSPALALVAPLGTDRNSAHSAVQDRCPHSSNGPLHSHPPGQRLALSTSLPNRGARLQLFLAGLADRTHSLTAVQSGALPEKSLPAFAEGSSKRDETLQTSPRCSSTTDTAFKSAFLFLVNKAG
jgi:enamine deaminase RidA (YjgF/YER057c/UK114 family)